MSARRFAIVSVVAGGLAAFLAGCAVPAPSSDSTNGGGGDTPLASEQVRGWDGTEFTTFGGTMSAAVAEKCPPPWELVSGQDIVDLQEALSTAEFHVCVFTATPDSVDPNVVDEIAYRVDAGGFELAMAYANYPFGSEDAQCVDGALAVFALMTTVIDGVTYGVNPGPGWCPSIQPENQALLDALQLTMVVRDTVGPNG